MGRCIKLFAMAALMASTALPVCAMGNRPYQYDVSGQVLDLSTGKPVEGAYVMAKYRGAEVGMAGNAIFCIRTAGMYTDTEGRFSFPYEGTWHHEGEWQPELMVIKPGYYDEHKTQDVNGVPQVWPRSDFEEYEKDYKTNPHQHVNLYLRPQDPKHPIYRYGNDAYCDRPKSLADVEAAVEFFNLKIQEYIRYGMDPESIKNATERVESQKQIARYYQRFYETRK
jgi:hypothetical protein